MRAFRPAESAAGGAFAPGPSPALARRKTPHFAGPRPQSAVRPDVACDVEVVFRPGVWWCVEEPAASGTAFRTTKKTSARSAHCRSSSLSCTLRRVASALSVSSQNEFVCSLPSLQLQGKPPCGLCQILHSAPYGRCVPLITAVLFASFFESRQKGRQQPRLNRGLMLGRCAKLIVVAHSEGGGVVYLFFVWIPACAGIFCAFLCASGCASWVCK